MQEFGQRKIDKHKDAVNGGVGYCYVCYCQDFQVGFFSSLKIRFLELNQTKPILRIQILLLLLTQLIHRHNNLINYKQIHKLRLHHLRIQLKIRIKMLILIKIQLQLSIKIQIKTLTQIPIKILVQIHKLKHKQQLKLNKSLHLKLHIVKMDHSFIMVDV